ncbi:PucR family transcriptional regulator [Streptomyces sp. NPDC054887]
MLVLVIPTFESGREYTRRLLEHQPFCVGPAVEIAHWTGSLRCASDLLFLRRSGIVNEQGVVHCDDHAPTLELFRDPQLLDVLSRQHLGPLAPLPRGQKERLARTLLTWLRVGRDGDAVSRRLRLHPRAVRQHMRELEGLYGARLRDPDLRFELELVLRSRQTTPLDPLRPSLPHGVRSVRSPADAPD